MSSGRMVDVIVGVDTVVESAGAILEKPDNAEHALRMLQSLSGGRHFVHTGVEVPRGATPLDTAAAAAAAEAAAAAAARIVRNGCRMPNHLDCRSETEKEKQRKKSRR